uniref:Uncharacterized protein n=1 Tax=Rhodopseudomonas palustris (strain BisA53) TaxID=316055 RepID=Q07TU2_RHOP5
MAGLVRWAVAAGLTLAASAAGAQEIAQVMAPYEIDAVPGARSESPPAVIMASDIGGPYAAIPPQAAMPRPAPALLPPREIYGLLRDDGYAPVGTPRLRGAFYTVAVTDPYGEDGRVVIDGRSGRIVRFIPAEADLAAPLWRRPAPHFREFGPVPRPPLAVPRVASRSAVPLPKPAPAQPVAGPARPIAAQPAPAAAPAPQTAAAPAPAPAPVEAKPAPVIAPTQAMPSVQGLE